MQTDHNAIVFWMLSLRRAVGQDVLPILEMYAEATSEGYGWHTASSAMPMAWN